MPLSIKRLRSIQSRPEMRPSATRKEISMPMALVSTTNMLSYEAPDLPQARQIMAARYSCEDDPHAINSPADVPGLTPDGSSAGSSPTVEYNHLSAYFPGPTVQRSPSARQAQAADANVPTLPQRVPSHSKREHERLARQRSLRGGESGKSTPVAPSSPTTTAVDALRTSFDLMGVSVAEAPPKPSPPAKHRSPVLGSNPFSPELEQLNEVAEDFKDLGEIEHEDTIYMREHGLVAFDVTDYIKAIGACYAQGPLDTGLPHSNITGWI